LHQGNGIHTCKYSSHDVALDPAGQRIHLNIRDINDVGRLSPQAISIPPSLPTLNTAPPVPPSRPLMPIHRLFLLVKLGKNVCYAYRARSVEAIYLCKKLEQDPVARYGTKDNVQANHQPGTVQDVDFWKHESIHERFDDIPFTSASN